MERSALSPTVDHAEATLTVPNQPIQLGLNCVGGRETTVMAGLLGYDHFISNLPRFATNIKQKGRPLSLIWCHVKSTAFPPNFPIHLQEPHLAWFLDDAVVCGPQSRRTPKDGNRTRLADGEWQGWSPSHDTVCFVTDISDSCESLHMKC